MQRTLSLGTQLQKIRVLVNRFRMLFALVSMLEEAHRADLVAAAWVVDMSPNSRRRVPVGPGLIRQGATVFAFLTC